MPSHTPTVTTASASVLALHAKPLSPDIQSHKALEASKNLLRVNGGLCVHFADVKLEFAGSPVEKQRRCAFVPGFRNQHAIVRLFDNTLVRHFALLRSVHFSPFLGCSGVTIPSVGAFWTSSWR